MRALTFSLLLVACAPHLDDAALQDWDPRTTDDAPVAEHLDLQVRGAADSGFVQFGVTGADAFATIWILRSDAPGDGACYPALEGACIGLQHPVVIHDVDLASARGVSSFATLVPDTGADTVCFQAIVMTGDEVTASTPACID